MSPTGEFPPVARGPPFSIWREKTKRMAVARPPPLPVVTGGLAVVSFIVRDPQRRGTLSVLPTEAGDLVPRGR